jgi:hypothetical protein
MVRTGALSFDLWKLNGNAIWHVELLTQCTALRGKPVVAWKASMT